MISCVAVPSLYLAVHGQPWPVRQIQISEALGVVLGRNAPRSEENPFSLALDGCVERG